MNLEDRGIIKWQPFNSCFNSELVIQDIKKHKNRVNFPTLSDDQLYIIAEKIKLAFNLKTIINFDYYYDGQIKNIEGTIEGLNLQEKKLYINKMAIYFQQILKIREI